MIDTLAEGVSMLDGTLQVTYPVYPEPQAPPGDDYFLTCKYQNDLSRTPRLFRLMISTQFKPDLGLSQAVYSQCSDAKMCSCAHRELIYGEEWFENTS
jgi:hypothetical protein